MKVIAKALQTYHVPGTLINASHTSTRVTSQQGHEIGPSTRSVVKARTWSTEKV